MKKISYVLLFIICIFMATKVYANDIKRITMDIYVDNSGNAHIKEEWTADLNSGTEGYKPYYNLGNSSITDYKVSMNGIPFSTINNWDVDASFTDKTYKAGLHPIDDGYELCFGISKYGTNKYLMEYTINNFVYSTNDADMIYWQLIPYDLSDKPDYVYIKIYSDFAYADDLDVWGYGNYGGYAYVYDGYIELVHEDELDSDEYMVVLAKFPKGTFNTSVELDNDFDYYYDLAEDGATSYNSKTNGFLNFIIGFISIIFSLLPYFIIGFVIFKAFNSNNYGTKKIKFAKDIKKLGDVPYFRDIPCNKDIFKGYWVACHFNLVKNKNDFLGAILLKWLKDGNIQNVVVNEKNSEKALKLLNNNNLSPLELELYDMIREASLDGVLEKNEFTSWCKNNYSTILKWFNKVIDDATMKFVDNGLILEEKKNFGNNYIVKEGIKELAIQVAGLKKFLNEFSNIKDRESIEIVHWEEYLMFAQIFGIAEKVAKEFKNLYPDVITDDYYSDIIFIHTISYDGVNAASIAKSRAESYSSGGGGFSSGGGGGGSFGGGGGGGGFR